MDKLKENLFPISVGAIVVGLGALIWFLIVSPLLDLGDKQSQLDAQTKKLKAYNASEYVPIEGYRDHLGRQLDILEGDANDAAAVYDGKVKRFQLFFDEQERFSSVSVFGADLNDRINTLLSQYQSDFGLQLVDPSSPRMGPPSVDLPEPTLPSDVPRVMKEYWILEEIVKACTAHQIGGFQQISFNRSGNAEGTTHEFYKKLVVLATIHLPYSKLEEFLTELYKSDRVLFQLQKLVFRNLPSMLEDYQDLVKEKEFPNRSASDAEPYDSVFPEPASDVELTLHALDWSGVPAEPDDEEDDEDN